MSEPKLPSEPRPERIEECAEGVSGPANYARYALRLEAEVERLKAESSITHEALRLSCTHSVLAQYVEQGNTVERLTRSLDNWKMLFDQTFKSELAATATLEAIEAECDGTLRSRAGRDGFACAQSILRIIHRKGDTDA